MKKKSDGRFKALDEIKKNNIEKIKVAVVDIDGVLRGKIIQTEKFLSAVENGLGVCNVVFGWDSSDVCYDNSAFTGWHSGYPDAIAQVDLSTYRKIPWENDLPFFLGDFDLDVCPRQLLKRVLARADKMGMMAQCGLEFEWFNFRETPQSWHDKGYRSPATLSPGMFGYSVLRSTLNQPFFTAIMDEMRKFRVPIEGLHTETGPGVLEAAIQFCDALEVADRAVLFKTGVKEIGLRFGIMPSFMAKWNTQLPGCSGHCHQSLWDKSGSRNLFYDEKDPEHMSATFKSYIAGQMLLLPEMLPLFAPTVNSYKRLVDGFWAPTKVTWGIDNRTVALRVIPGSKKSTRLETRVPGSDINPYLAVAAAVGAGLHGIEKKLELKHKPIVGNGYTDATATRLPKTLYDATEKMAQSKLAREIFGDGFVDHFTKSRFWEWKQFQESVTSWEMQRYFEII